jgi:hypothetical protein
MASVTARSLSATIAIDFSSPIEVLKFNRDLNEFHVAALLPMDLSGKSSKGNIHSHP